MVKNLSFYLKYFVKRPFLYLALLFTLVLTIRIVEVLQVSLFDFVKYFYFGFIAFNLFFVICTVQLVNKTYEMTDFLERHPLVRIRTIFLAAFILTVSTSIVPLLLMTLYSDSSFYFTFKALAHFFVLWTLSNMLATALGLTTGVLLKNNFALLFACGLYIGLFLVMPKNNVVLIGIYQYLNLFDDHLFTKGNVLAGTIFNVYYFLDKLFIVLMILFLFLCMYIVLARMYRWISIPVASLVLVCTVFITTIHPPQVTEQEVQLDVAEENRTFLIPSYQMNVSLTNRFKNTVTLSLQTLTEGKTFEFLLADLFSVDRVMIANEEVPFTHHGHLLKIDYAFEQGQSLLVEINYEGHVYVIDHLGNEIYYVANRAVNLPGNTFHWYPVPSYPFKSQFEIAVDTPASIFSNLPSTSKNKFVGEAASVNFFAGQYETFIDQDITYMLPLNTNFRHFQEGFEDKIQQELEHEVPLMSRETLELIDNKSYRQVIVGMLPTNQSGLGIYLLEDTVLVAY